MQNAKGERARLHLSLFEPMCFQPMLKDLYHHAGFGRPQFHSILSISVTTSVASKFEGGMVRVTALTVMGFTVMTERHLKQINTPSIFQTK